MTSEAREHVLDAGCTLFQRQGYAGTDIKRILAEPDASVEPLLLGEGVAVVDDIDRRLRALEHRLFDHYRITVREQYIQLSQPCVRLRLLECGEGPPVVLLHGVSMPAALWAPLMAEMPDFRLLAVDLPGHGLSDAFNYRGCNLRRHAGELLGGILDELQLADADFIGSSLGAQLPMWLAMDAPHRLHRLVAFGDPAVAFRGARARGGLGFLSIPGVGWAMLQAPIPLFAYGLLLGQAAGQAALSRVPREVVEYARLAGRRPGYAATVASLMRRVNRFRWPRAENVLSDKELSRIEQPMAFVWGDRDPYLSPSAAAPSVARIPRAELHILPAGHFPWLDDAARSASAARRCLLAADEPKS